MNNTRHVAIFVTGFFFYLGLSLCPAYGDSNTTVVLDADGQYAFAEHYFQDGEYAKAVVEYERFAYFFPKDTRVPQALYQAGESHFRAGHMDDAVRSFQKIIKEYGHTDLASKAYFRISDGYVRLNKYGDALDILGKLLWTNPDRDTKDEIAYRKGWIYLETDNWDKASMAFSHISDRNREAYGLPGLLEDMEKKSALKTKDPEAAGFLAVLPGAGHLYCERYQDAFISFALNGLMIVAAWEAFENDNEALGVLLSVVEFGFYTGNIYSAVNAAHKYNRKQKNEFFQYLKRHATLEASAVRWDKKPALALTCHIRF